MYIIIVFINIIIMNTESILKENELLKLRIIELEEHLKRYTNSDGHKRYYEKNKDKVKNNAGQYLKNMAETNPDKLKEYRRTAYLNRKEKLKNLIVSIDVGHSNIISSNI